MGQKSHTWAPLTVSKKCHQIFTDITITLGLVSQIVIFGEGPPDLKSELKMLLFAFSLVLKMSGRIQIIHN